MKFFILPGMGADSSMYGSEYQKIENMVFVDWPVYKKERSIKQVAERVVDLYQIKDGDIAGGSSLGGIVAAEISKFIKLKKLFLIGSSLYAEDLNPKMKWLSRYAGTPPVKSLQVVTGVVSLFMNERNRTLIDMFRRTDAMFIKAMIKALNVWGGCPNPECDVYSIHGGKDRVISPDSNSIILDDAGHTIVMTHGKQVVDFILSHMD